MSVLRYQMYIGTGYETVPLTTFEVYRDADPYPPNPLAVCDNETDAVEIVRRWNAHEDLLEALEEAIRWADESENDPCEVCGVKLTVCSCWLGLARAAIAKARGGK